MVQNKAAERNEKLFDAVVKVAVEEAFAQEMESFPNEGELNKMYPRSTAMDKRVKGIINKAAKNNRKKNQAPLFVRVAASIVVLITVVGITLFSVEASRNFIRNIFVNIQDDHVAFDFGDLGRTTYRERASLSFALYGFEYVSSHHMDTQSIVIFVNEAGERIVFQNHYRMELGVFIDNENRAFTIQELGGMEIYVFESFDGELQNVVMWAMWNDVYIITSAISIEALIEIVASLVSEQQ